MTSERIDLTGIRNRQLMRPKIDDRYPDTGTTNLDIERNLLSHIDSQARQIERLQVALDTMQARFDAADLLLIRVDRFEQRITTHHWAAAMQDYVNMLRARDAYRAARAASDEGKE